VTAISERLRQRVHKALGVGGDPRRLAAAWAVGVAIALSPFIGFHTVLALLAAVVLRLNKIEVLLGTLVINPWTLPIYFPSAVLVGRRITGMEISSLAIPDPERIFHMAMWREQIDWLRPVLVSWAVGGLLAAVVGGSLTYFVSLRLIRILRRHVHHHEQT
jgi:uncharacterized protein